ncbi:glycosyltransferase [Fusobacterium sp.]|uniref:glycosyltransferase n=1 Tax=Fusobacterium sp. TaxID=68766 RepID=UPI00260E465D|nr:glycosyltransferase [Fusobacterium sp.]
MKILHIITSLELGGAEKLLTDLVPFQQNKGHFVKVLILSDKGAVFKKTLENKGVEVLVCKSNSIKSFKNIFHILREIKRENYDIVHTHLVHAQYWTRLAKLFDTKKRKYITTEHSTSNRRRESKLMQFIDKFIFKGFDKIVSISEATEKSLKEWLEISDDRFEIIYNGIDPTEFRNSLPYEKIELGVKNEDYLLMMISRFHESKNQKGVIEALKWLPVKYKLVLVGDGKLENDVKEYCEKNNLSNRVKFLGLRRDIPKLLKTADIVIQYSFFEGFGITAVEAMASGKPVIASDVPGLKQVVENAGYLVSIDDSKELAKAILALRVENNYEIISKKCLEKSENYTIESCANNYLALYKKEIER